MIFGSGVKLKVCLGKVCKVGIVRMVGKNTYLTYCTYHTYNTFMLFSTSKNISAHFADESVSFSSSAATECRLRLNVACDLARE